MHLYGVWLNSEFSRKTASTVTEPARHSTGFVEPRNHRIYMVLNTIGYLGSAVHILLIPLFLWLGYLIPALFNIGSALVWPYAWWLNRKGRHAASVSLMAVEIALHTLVAVPTVGWDAGFQYYLLGSVPFIVLNNRLSPSHIAVITAAWCIMFALLAHFFSGQAHQYAYPWVIEAMHYANAVIAFTAIGLSSYYFRLASTIAERELEHLATTDPLTGLFNRRKMEELLRRQHHIADRGGAGFSLILADIDHFKELNDTYGHDCGDEMLRCSAAVFRKRLREADAVARWGGEEFLIMLPGTGAERAGRIAEELRAAIAEQLTTFCGRRVELSMTFGVAQLVPGDPFEQTLTHADEALYHGKQTGRDKVTIYGDTTERHVVFEAAGG